jgi:hypothetical protein
VYYRGSLPAAQPVFIASRSYFSVTRKTVSQEKSGLQILPKNGIIPLIEPLYLVA